MPQLRRLDLINLARHRLAVGERLQRLHTPDGVGCCTRCGRPYPCRGQELGVLLTRHYRQVLRRELPDAPAPAQPDRPRWLGRRRQERGDAPR